MPSHFAWCHDDTDATDDDDHHDHDSVNHRTTHIAKRTDRSAARCDCRVNNAVHWLCACRHRCRDVAHVDRDNGDDDSGGRIGNDDEHATV